MNLKWIIIGVIFCIVLVLMGSNPIEERQKKEEAAMEGKDRLVESIKEHNAKKTGLPGGMGASFMSSGSRADRPQAPAAPARPSSYPSYMQNQGSTERTTSYPSATGTQPAVPSGGQATAPKEPEGYYPPPPLPSTR